MDHARALDAFAANYARLDLTPADYATNKALFEKLVARFGPSPTIKYLDRRNGRAHWPSHAHPDGLIELPVKPWRGTAESLLHEYAHIILFKKGDHGHGREFFDALRKVVAVAGEPGTPYPYRWETEYKTVYNYAKGAGLTAKPHHKDAFRKAAGRTATVKAGDRVAWNGRTGVVVRAWKNHRARVRTAFGEYLVPQWMLKPLGTTGTSPVTMEELT